MIEHGLSILFSCSGAAGDSGGVDVRWTRWRVLRERDVYRQRRTRRSKIYSSVLVYIEASELSRDGVDFFSALEVINASLPRMDFKKLSGVFNRAREGDTAAVGTINRPLRIMYRDASCSPGSTL
jgi:hypothetical protein